MPNASIAVVVTAYNYGRYLEECLRSVDRQTQPPEAVVIVDDASTDCTPEVLARVIPSLRIRSRVSVHRHETRRGAARTLNHALSALVGTPLVANVDADDIVAPRYVEALSETLRAHPQAAFTYPRIRLFGSQSGIYASYPYDATRLMFEGNYIPNVALMRREAVLEVGGYRDLPTHLDWDLWLAMLDHGYTGVLTDEVLYEWRRHDGGLSQKPTWQRLQTRASIQWRHRRLLARHPAAGLKWTTRALCRRLPGRSTGAAVLTPSGWVERDDAADDQE